MPNIVKPVIPAEITVHLGTPDSQAQNVTLAFTDYIKNVASGEIYPTWPENALRANIYAIITFALNRIYTEWYPSRGYIFDITSTTQFDQSFAPDREVFENINNIVNEIFDEYIVRNGSVEPLFASFCNGTTSQCEGLSQWGTVALANEGLAPIEILRRYYGNDISILTNTPVLSVGESYPGEPLKLGDDSNNVKIIQTELNRISQNYPAIPRIRLENGLFGLDTEAAVRKFQEIFSFSQTGTVDKPTWYGIKRYYNGVKRLSELTAEGISPEEASLPYSLMLTPGMSGLQVRALQYYLDLVAYLNPELDVVSVTGVFDETTKAAVEEFQRFYGLPVTGVVNNETFNVLNREYRAAVASLPENYEGGNAKIFPGYVLGEGMSSQAVTDLQTYLALIGRNFPEIPEIPITGYYGTQTRDAVYTFQRLFGLPQSGLVGLNTWQSIANEYNFLRAN